MSSRVIRYEACPKCRSVGNDSRGDNLVRYADGGAHCFACGHHEFGGAGYVLQQQLEKDNGAKSLLPNDFTREVPGHAWKWLLQYGLPWSYWKESVGYSPSKERLVFRVGEASTGTLQFSIGRYTPQVNESGEPLQRGGGSSVDRTPRKWHVWGDCHRHCEVIGSGESIVLVEDLISAHCVGQVTEAIPLFGVNIHTPHLYHITNSGKPVKLWLDKDQEQSVKKKAMQLQALTGVNVDIVVTDKDPKQYSLKEINEALNV